MCVQRSQARDKWFMETAATDGLEEVKKGVFGPGQPCLEVSRERTVAYNLKMSESLKEQAECRGKSEGKRYLSDCPHDLVIKDLD